MRCVEAADVQPPGSALNPPLKGVEFGQVHPTAPLHNNYKRAAQTLRTHFNTIHELMGGSSFPPSIRFCMSQTPDDLRLTDGVVSPRKVGCNIQHIYRAKHELHALLQRTSAASPT